VIEEHISSGKVTIKLEIRKAARIEAWLRRYRQEGEGCFHKPIGRPPKAKADQRELERLQMENALLKKSDLITGYTARTVQCQAISHSRRIHCEREV